MVMKIFAVVLMTIFFGKECNPSGDNKAAVYAFARLMQGGAQMVDDAGNPINAAPQIQRFLLLAFYDDDTTGFQVDSVWVNRKSAAFSINSISKPGSLEMENGEKWLPAKDDAAYWYRLEIGYGLFADTPPGEATYRLFWHQGNNSGFMDQKERVLREGDAY